MVRIGIIGAGRVGTCLAGYLAARGYPVAGFFSRTFASAQTAAGAIGGQAYTDLCALATDSDVVLITTPDDAIAQTAAALAAGLSEGKRRVYIHTSGATPAAALSPLAPHAAGLFALHPIYSFSGRYLPPEEVARIPVTVEGQGEDAFIKEAFPHAVSIPAAQKPLYHAALCMASNFLVTLMAHAWHAAEGAGLPPEMLRPLVEKTVENLFVQGPEAALTGPISRGDAGTVRAHLAALGDETDFYQILGRYTAQLAEQAGRLDQTQRNKILEVLQDGKTYNA